MFVCYIRVEGKEIALTSASRSGKNPQAMQICIAKFR